MDLLQHLQMAAAAAAAPVRRLAHMQHCLPLPQSCCMCSTSSPQPRHSTGMFAQIACCDVYLQPNPCATMPADSYPPSPSRVLTSASSPAARRMYVSLFRNTGTSQPLQHTAAAAAAAVSFAGIHQRQHDQAQQQHPEVGGALMHCHHAVGVTDSIMWMCTCHPHGSDPAPSHLVLGQSHVDGMCASKQLLQCA